MAITLQRIAELSEATLYGDGDVEVSSITLNSSELEPGSVFAALPGSRVHGASFAAGTAAAAIVTDGSGWEILQAAGETRPVVVVEDIRAVLGFISAEIYGWPSHDLCVLGVTGTSGKTTTSYLLEAGLLAAGHSVGLVGTTGTRINRQPIPTTLTTPEAPTLQRLFARMRDEGVTHVVMEVSSHALELGRVRGTRFAVGGFSNLSQDHLDFHPTMEEYFQAKALLFIGEQAAEKSVICTDDEWGQRMAQAAVDAGKSPVRVSLKGNSADISARLKEVEPTGAQDIELRMGEQSWNFTLPLPGEFNIANAALACAMANSAGVEMNSFIAAISDVAVPGRMERVNRGQDFIAVVDYAHKPAAVAAVLDTLSEQLDQAGTGGRIGIVVGAGGDRDSTKRPLMGQAAALRADYVVVTDDNPRTEDPAPIRAAVLQGARNAQSERNPTIVEEPSRAQAIDAVVSWARPGDAVIVVGKGHEVGQIVGTETLHFDDREELARALTSTGSAAAVDRGTENQ